MASWEGKPGFVFLSFLLIFPLFLGEQSLVIPQRIWARQTGLCELFLKKENIEVSGDKRSGEVGGQSGGECGQNTEILRLNREHLLKK